MSRNGAVIRVQGNKYKKKEWDNKPASHKYIKEVIRVSENQIIWGCNYYLFPFTSGRIVWDKVNDGSDQSDCEIAFNSLTERVDIFRFMWRGMFQGKSIKEGHIQQGNKKLNETRIHPTQKPVALYRWLVQNYAKPGDLILDTHTGSASSLISYEIEGFKYHAYELDKDYYKDSTARLIKARDKRDLNAMLKPIKDNTDYLKDVKK